MQTAQPVGPPPKKSRSGAGGGGTGAGAGAGTGVGVGGVGGTSRFGGDAIARRRAELRKLQDRGGGSVATGPNAQTRGLLEKARSQLQQPQQPQQPPPPSIPQPAGLIEKRSSDIFPNVQKIHPSKPLLPAMRMSTTPLASTSATGAPPLRPQVIVPTNFSSRPPKVPSQITSNPPRTNTPQKQNGLVSPSDKAAVASATMPAMTPNTANHSQTSTASSRHLARRLDSKFANETRNLRAKSAPPVRPPPPPPARPAPSPAAAEAPSKIAPPPAKAPPSAASVLSKYRKAPTATAPARPKSAIASNNSDHRLEPYLMPEKSLPSKYTSNRPAPITPNFGKPKQSSRRKKESTTQPEIIPNQKTIQNKPLPNINTKYPALAAAEDEQVAKELKKANREREDAYRQIARLKEQLQRMQKDKEGKRHDTLVDLAKGEGNEAAMKWARQQISGQTITSPPFRGLSPGRRAATPVVGPPARQRVATPNPRRLGSEDELEYLKLAAKSNPVEYTSMIATYTVRRPYSTGKEEPHWAAAGIRSAEEYQRKANILDPSSIEIAATITADGSTFVLHGICEARHRRTTQQKWRYFTDIEDRDDPLGCIMYIDQEADEGEYWLDDIYEEALSTRETYCSSLVSAASALKSTLAENGVGRHQFQQSSSQNRPSRFHEKNQVVESQQIPQTHESHPKEKPMVQTQQLQRKTQTEALQFQQKPPATINPSQFQRKPNQMQQQTTAQPPKTMMTQPPTNGFHQALEKPLQQPPMFTQNGGEVKSQVMPEKHEQQASIPPTKVNSMPEPSKQTTMSSEQQMPSMEVSSKSQPAVPEPNQKSDSEPLDSASEKAQSTTNDKPRVAKKEVTKPKKKNIKNPPPVEEEPATDMLSSLLGFLFSSIFGLLWLVLVKIPYRIISFSLLCLVLSVMYHVLWLYAANDHGAIEMNAGVGLGFNQPGII